VDIGDAPASIKHGVPGMDARREVQMAQEEAGRPDRFVWESFFDEAFFEGLPQKNVAPAFGGQTVFFRG